MQCQHDQSHAFAPIIINNYLTELESLSRLLLAIVRFQDVSIQIVLYNHTLFLCVTIDSLLHSIVRIHLCFLRANLIVFENISIVKIEARERNCSEKWKISTMIPSQSRQFPWRNNISTSFIRLAGLIPSRCIARKFNDAWKQWREEPSFSIEVERSSMQIPNPFADPSRWRWRIGGGLCSEASRTDCNPRHHLFSPRAAFTKTRRNRLNSAPLLNC